MIQDLHRPGFSPAARAPRPSLQGRGAFLCVGVARLIRVRYSEVMPFTKTRNDEDRFWEKVDVGHPLGCWVWLGYTTRRGYGRFGRAEWAHRWAYEFFYGPLPKDEELDHLCRNRRCVNPDHLELVTHAENMRRGVPQNGQARKTHCKHGHEFTEANTYRYPDGRRCCRACKCRHKRINRQRRRDGTLGSFESTEG